MASMDANTERRIAAIMHPDTLRCIGWRGSIMLRLVCRSMAESGEDAYRTLCDVIAADVGLYLPSIVAGPGAWKKLFFEHLYPARNKWGIEGEHVSDFKIRVAVRFKPGQQRECSDIVLPLHQRLKMLKKGEKISFEEAKGEKGLPVELIEQLAHSGVDVDAEVLEMLIEARQLACSVQSAEAAARSEERAHGHADTHVWDSTGMSGGGSSDDVERNNGAVLSVGGDGGVGTGRDRGDTQDGGSKKDDVAGNDENENVEQRKGSGKPRILAVMPCKVVMYVPGAGIRPFHFANTFDQLVNQEDLYSRYAQGAVVSALNGFNACVLAYGQTGSGKTYSVFGPQDALDFRVSETGPLAGCHGIVVRAACEILDAARLASGTASEISVSAQYVQIYNEQITDLMTGARVDLRTGPQGRMILQGASEISVRTRSQFVALLRQGEAKKRFAATAMNDHSSRAHTIIVLHLLHTSSKYSGAVAKSELHLVDLAGCEQIKKSKVVGQAKREAVGINSSLCVLKKCIRALNEDKGHVPYLESKLTMLLRSAFGGNSRTYALITGSTDDKNVEETLQAIRFGEECSMVSNQASQAATSLKSAAHAIDMALQQCQHGMKSLQERNKTHLPAFKKLQMRFASLSRKRLDLLDAK